MCDQATQQIIDGIVTDFVSKRYIFTALNVSRNAQKNHGVSYRHNDLKGATHRNYRDGEMTYDDGGVNKNYHQRLMPLPKVQADAIVYYPDGVDPDNYDLSAILDGPIDTKDGKVNTPTAPTSVPDPFGLNAPATGTAVATAPVVLKSSTPLAPNPTAEYPVDKRGRLWLPRKAVTSLGGTRGTELEVTVSGKSLVVTAKGKSPSSPFTSYKVDSKGNIAISRNVFAAAGLTDAKYDIIDMNGQVVVKA